MSPDEHDEPSQALRNLFTIVFDKLVDESFGGTEAAAYAQACTKLLQTLAPDIVDVTEVELHRSVAPDT